MKRSNYIVQVLLALVLAWRYFTFTTIHALGAPPNQTLLTQLFGVMGILCTLIGTVLHFKVHSYKSLVFALYCCSMGIHWGYFPQFSHTLQGYLQGAYLLISMLMGSFLLHFLLTFLDKSLSRFSFTLVYLPGLLGLGLLFFSLRDPALLPVFQVVEMATVTLYGLVGFVIFFIRYPKLGGDAKGAAQWIFWGILIGNGPYLLGEFLPFLHFQDPLGAQPYAFFFLLMIILFATSFRSELT